MSRIRQSWVLTSFMDSFNKRWGTHPATNIKEPLVVFGCFHQEQVDLIAKWQAPVVVVWVGSDSMYLRTGKYGVDYTPILHAPHVKHVAISKWIIDDLSACGVPHIYLPITHVDFKQFKPVSLGDHVYYYGPPQRSKLYGREILYAVREKLPDVKFYVANSHEDWKHENMPEVYKNSFVGLRPTSHDGQSTTVAEMGLMGRKTIHNGMLPSAVAWDSVDDIVESIRNEQKKVGTTDFGLAKRVREFLDIDENWLHTEFYGGVT